MTESGMKQIVRVRTTTYRWWRNDRRDIPAEHVEELERLAEEYLSAKAREGFTSGQMLHLVQPDEEDLGVHYTGYWEVVAQDGAEPGQKQETT
jgi:hypothetical protein